MRYSVQGPDGRSHGPVELEGLKQWVREGRVTPDTVVLDESTGTHLPARYVQELAPVFAEGLVPAVPVTMPSQAAVAGEPQCFHCGLILVMGTTICPRCGMHLYPMPIRKLTGIGFVDGCLGVLTVIVLCMVTAWMVSLRIPYLSGLLSVLPIAGPIALFASFRNRYRAYSNGLLAGCILIPLFVFIALLTGFALLANAIAGAAKGWKCSF